MTRLLNSMSSKYVEASHTWSQMDQKNIFTVVYILLLFKADLDSLTHFKKQKLSIQSKNA